MVVPISQTSKVSNLVREVVSHVPRPTFPLSPGPAQRALTHTKYTTQNLSVIALEWQCRR